MKKLEGFSMRPMKRDDLKVIFNWYHSTRFRHISSNGKTINRDEQIEWFRKEQDSLNSLVLILFERDIPSGFVRFSEISKEHSHCYWAYYIDDGHAPEIYIAMGILALDKLFTEVGMRKVCAEILDSQATAMQLHKRLGFEMEGRFASHIRKGNQYKDIIHMALFADKWPEVKEGLLSSL